MDHNVYLRLARGGGYSPVEVLDSVQRYTPDHMPGYPLLISLWGSLTGRQIEMGRIFSILAGLLFLAVAYRCAHDFVAPSAGLMTLILLAGTAFFNFYIAYMRMYTLLPLISAFVLWLYLRIAHQLRRPRRLDYVALAAAVAWLIQTHLFSALFLLMLGIYHLLFAPKGRRWLWLSASVIAAVLLMLPFVAYAVSVADILADDRAPHSLDGIGAVQVWLSAYLNGQLGFLPVALFGLFVGWRRGTIRLQPCLVMPVIYLLLLAAVAQGTTWVALNAMHYHLAGWLPFVLLLVHGFYALFRARPLVILLPLSLAVAGAAFHATGDSWRYVVFDYELRSSPPTHLLSRLAAEAAPQPVIHSYSSPELYYVVLGYRGNFYFPAFINYSQADHYFARLGLDLDVSADHADLASQIARDVINAPSLWTSYQSGRTDAERNAEVADLLRGHGYERCSQERIGVDTIIDQYMWIALNCDAMQPAVISRVDKMSYEFFGASLDAATARLHFSDRWTRSGDGWADAYNMSWQLLSAKGENVAQLDLPLMRSDEPRSFYIDVSGAAQGVYTLVAIVYDRQTGERQLWQDDEGASGAMLPLAELALP